MVRRLQIAILLAFISFLIAKATGQEIAGRKEMIRQIIQPAIGYRKTVGIVVGIVTQNGREVYAFGKAGRDDGGKLNGDTVFEIGSITKVFTTILLADMAAHGEISVLDPIDSFLPNEVKAPSYNNSRITLFDLATHTAGLPRQPTNLTRKNIENPFADYTVADLYAFLSGFKLDRAIGSKYEYSNTGLGLLGHVLSLRTGMSYEDLVISRICAPLRMSNTGIHLTTRMEARLAKGHDLWGNPVRLWDLPTLAGAGALRSTVNDLNRFVAANLGLQRTPVYPSMLNSHMPRVRTGYENEYVGLGWWVESSKSVEIVSHGGDTAGYSSFIGFAKKRRVGVVLLANFRLGEDAAVLGERVLERLIAVSGS